MSSTIISTRHIRLYVDYPSEEKEKKIEIYRRLRTWQRMVFMASNQVTTNLYIQDKVKELFYFQDDIKLKLADKLKDNEGILVCSRENTTYRVLSQKYKTELPASIFSLVNRSVYKYYSSEKSEYFSGVRSLRNYKSNLPIPFTARSIHNLRYDDQINNFRFSLFNDEKYRIPFKTFLGRDSSNNKIVIERCIKGEYKIRDSFLALKDGDIFFYLVVEMPKLKNTVCPELKAEVKLSFMTPLVVIFNSKEYHIGNKDSFIYKRLAIQEGLWRRQSVMKYNSGGRGRKNKTKGIKEFKLKEKNFISTYTHQLSCELISFCLENKIGKIQLVNIIQTREEAKVTPFVIRNWSFGSLLDKLKYKCIKNDIELILN